MRLYMDVNCSVGQRANIINESIPYKIEDLLVDQRKFGIDLSLVSVSYANDYSIFIANNEIFDLSKKHKTIMPIISLYPGFNYDINNSEEYLNSCFQKGAKGIKLLLNNFFVFNEKMLIPIFVFAEKSNLPIIINAKEMFDNMEILKTISSFNNLKVIITGVNFAYVNSLLCAIEESENIFFALDGCTKHNLIEHLYYRIGEERILFSSGYPMNDAGSVKAMIEYSEIPEEAKNKIASTNAIKLFNISSNFSKQNRECDPFIKQIESGRNLRDVIASPIFDVHTHFNGEESISSGWYGSGVTLESLLNSCRLNGVSSFITSSIDGLSHTGIIGNKIVREAIEKYPGIIYGYASANPYYKDDLNDCIKHLKEKQFLGVKLYPAKNHYPYTGKNYKDVLEKTRDLGKLFLLHGTPEDAKRILEIYKGLKVILAHATQSYEFMDKAMETMEEYPQLYIDICNRYLIGGAIEHLVNNGFEDRILFGSDSALLSQSAHIGFVGYSNISFKAKEKILSKNFMELLNKS